MSGSDRPAVRWSLRSAVAEDAPAVSRIWVQGWADGHLGHVPVSLAAARTDDWFARRAAERVPDMTVAEAGGSVVGFTVVIADEVEQLYVDRAARGTGVAEALLVEAERQIRATGGQAWLAVAVGNARAGGSTSAAAGATREILRIGRSPTKALSSCPVAATWRRPGPDRLDVLSAGLAEVVAAGRSPGRSPARPYPPRDRPARSRFVER